MIKTELWWTRVEPSQRAGRPDSCGGYIVIKQFKTVDVTVLSDWLVDTSRISR